MCTGICAGDDSALILDGDDGGTHGLAGVEEIFVLSFLGARRLVHICNFKKYSNKLSL